MHKSFGPVPPDKFSEAVNSPSGGAAKIIRKFVPGFGITPNEKGELKFRFTCQRTIIALERAKVEVEADSEEAAEKLLDEMDWEHFHWSDYGCQDKADYDVLDCVQIP